MEYNSGTNRARNFKLTERVARGRFEITNRITPELYDKKLNYQLIVSITKFENVQYTQLSSFCVYSKHRKYIFNELQIYFQ